MYSRIIYAASRGAFTLHTLTVETSREGVEISRYTYHPEPLLNYPQARRPEHASLQLEWATREIAAWKAAAHAIDGAVVRVKAERF